MWDIWCAWFAEFFTINSAYLGNSPNENDIYILRHNAWSCLGISTIIVKVLLIYKTVQKIDKYQTNRAGPIASSKLVQVHVNSTKAYDHTNTTNCMQCLLSWFGGSNHLLPKTIITCLSKYYYQDIIQMLSVLWKN